jgi:hypothetical protein
MENHQPGDEVTPTVISVIPAREMRAGQFLLAPHGDAYVELVSVTIEEDEVTADAGWGQVRLDLDEMVQVRDAP